MLITILIDYIAGIYIEKTDNQKNKKFYLIISILSTCLVLFIFKYFNFFNQNMIYLGELFDFKYKPVFDKFILPIGLSFHTFQSLSYVIEVYRGNQKAEKHFGIYSLYVMFYPQLVTGPIERPQNLLVQLRENKPFLYDNIAQGLRLILFGLFAKMVIADNLAVPVDAIYDNPEKYNAVHIFTALVFYSFQIYCDFYGYSMIAVGCAKAMGYDLMDNFKTPYFSKSIGEFWQRWHISLSSWFRDYLYFPLGGNKVRVPRWIVNILIVFIVSGLWHGANWTFVLWGLAHGVAYILENLISRVVKLKPSENKVVRHIQTSFGILKTFIIVTLIWILFRASSLEQAQLVFKFLFTNFQVADDFHIEPRLWVLLALFLLIDLFLFNNRFDFWLNNKNIILRWSLYTILIFSILVFSSVNNFPFIYFQF